MAKDLDVGMKCIKYMLFITNFMFVMIGFLLISIGATITTIYNDFELFMEDHYFSPAALFVAIGVIIFIVALFGCVGAIKESTCLVNTYATFLFLILILQVSAVIAAYAMRGNIYSLISERMTDTMRYYPKNSYVQNGWDALQSQLQCCGVYSSTEWEGYLSGANLTTAVPNIPDSCIRDTIDNIPFLAGCLDRLHFVISECALLIGTGGICVAIVQALGVIFASMLAKSIRRIKTEEEYKKQQNRMRLYAQLAKGTDEKPTPVIYTANNDSTDA
ncbi:CD63 antigen-like [Onthophagus taurus]|uniref:CD63 antigen-like n=1 Tax=Onthophagus taurus TaxID=166361 RepID=UPI000C2021C6|nr:CD63 antigen-like [Onthophagus taurus]XP_022910372.1 CD63 antigen-like [Onthophagus taurus]